MDSSPSITRILLIRHGQSLANAGKAINDDSTNSLTELGQQQAQAFADSFSHLPSRFLVSPYLRARQTAEPLLRRLPAIPVETWPVHEFHYLSAIETPTIEEQRMPEILSYWERMDPAYSADPQAESFSAFLARTRDTIQRLSKEALEAPGGCHVLFTHGLWMQAFRMLLLFPKSTDLELMRNFRRFHFVNFVNNLEALDFEVANGHIRPLNQEHLNTFRLEGASSNESIE